MLSIKYHSTKNEWKNCRSVIRTWVQCFCIFAGELAFFGSNVRVEKFLCRKTSLSLLHSHGGILIYSNFMKQCCCCLKTTLMSTISVNEYAWGYICIFKQDIDNFFYLNLDFYIQTQHQFNQNFSPISGV